LGCKKIQGYFYGRPMEAVEVDKLFQQRRFAQRVDVS
jgi:EAL domain-containing protein (putative c-di-GMP-specific phosphodiesterase class I)